jgi:hypothetical protein
LEAWHPGIRLLSEWNYFEQPEPRLGSARLLRYVPIFSKGTQILQYRLGNGAREEEPLNILGEADLAALVGRQPP